MDLNVMFMTWKCSLWSRLLMTTASHKISTNRTFYFVDQRRAPLLRVSLWSLDCGYLVHTRSISSGAVRVRWSVVQWRVVWHADMYHGVRWKVPVSFQPGPFAVVPSDLHTERFRCDAALGCNECVAERLTRGSTLYSCSCVWFCSCFCSRRSRPILPFGRHRVPTRSTSRLRPANL